MRWKDGRFQNHPSFPFAIHNILLRERAREQSGFFVRKRLGEDAPSDGNALLHAQQQFIKDDGEERFEAQVRLFGTMFEGTRFAQMTDAWVKTKTGRTNVVDKLICHNGSNMHVMSGYGPPTRFSWRRAGGYTTSTLLL